MPERPTAVTVFAILNLVFGALALICSPLAMIGSVSPFGGVGAPELPGMATAAFRNFMLFNVFTGVIAGAIAVASGIGMLQMREWGRKLAIGYGVFDIVITVVSGLVQMQMLPGMMGQAGAPPEMARFVGVAGLAGGVAGICCGLIYPILLLYFMTQRDIIQSFEAAEQMHTGYPPREGY